MSDRVIELLKCLPYIRMDGPNDIYEFAMNTYPCVYRRDYFRKVPASCAWEIPDTTERENNFPNWVVPLTYGKVVWNTYMLDTTDGKDTPTLH